VPPPRIEEGVTDDEHPDANAGREFGVLRVADRDLLVVLFPAYCCGGHVDGRMVRFNGIRQGLGVWLWHVVMVLVVVAIAAFAGARYGVLAHPKVDRAGLEPTE